MRPARPVVTRSPHRSVGLIPVPWLQPEPIAHESRLERDFVHCAVLCTGVLSVAHQPFKLAYELDGEHHHVPDFLVRLRDGRTLVIEVKPSKFVDEHRPKFDAVTPILRARGMDYYVITERHLPKASLAQASLWLRYARSGLEPKGVELVFDLLPGDQRRSWEEVLAAGLQPHVLFHLLGRRRVHSESGLALTASTRLFMDKEPNHECLQFERWFACTPWRPGLPA